MATTCYFEEVITDQGHRARMEVELGRGSFYAGCTVPGGTGEQSIYLRVDDRLVIMDRATARRFAEAVQAVGHAYGLLD